MPDFYLSFHRCSLPSLFLYLTEMDGIRECCFHRNPSLVIRLINRLTTTDVGAMIGSGSEAYYSRMANEEVSHQSPSIWVEMCLRGRIIVCLSRDQSAYSTS